MSKKQGPRLRTEGESKRISLQSNQLADVCQAAAIYRLVETKLKITALEHRAVVSDRRASFQSPRALYHLAAARLILLSPKRDGIVVRPKLQRGATNAE